MKRILATTALATAMIMPAFATPPEAKDQVQMNTDVKAETKADLSVMTDIDLPEVDLSDEDDIKVGVTDDHTWINKTVYDSEMVAIGEVERVSLNMAGEVEAIIVESGGALDIGGHEVMVSSDNFMKVSTDDDQIDIQLTMTEADFKQLPTFDEDSVSDYTLSDDDLIDGVDEQDEVGAEIESKVEIN